MHRTIVVSFLIAVLSALQAPVGAQVVVQESVTTDTVDLFAKNNVPEKSGVLAMGASLLFPGLGQQYLGLDSKALIYFSTEALFIFGAVYCSFYGKKVLSDAKAYAAVHARIEGGAGADDQFWQDVGQYDDTKSFNDDQERAYRDESKDYLSPNLQWRWDDPANRKDAYNSYIKSSMRYDVASSFFIGAMIINRLVSFIDARFASRHQKTALPLAVRLYPRFDPRDASSGISINAEF